MNEKRKELIKQCRIILDEAEFALGHAEPERYERHMCNLLNHLTAEPVDQIDDRPEPAADQTAAEQPAAEQAAAQVSEQQIDEQLAKDEAAEPEQPDEKAKTDAANRRTAGNSPW